MPNLTAKQHLVFEAIRKLSEEKGLPPSYREIMAALGYQSTGSIYRFVKALKSKGALEQTPRSWRNVSLSKAEGHEGQVINVEVIGQVARQHPPELFSKTSTTAVPSHMVSQNGPVYGLMIQDASFLDEHLLPGDMILVEPTEMVEPGELVLASTHQSIIGHFFDEDDTYRFRSSPYAPSGAISSIITQVEDTQIWGIIVGVIRSTLPQKQ